MFTKNRLVNVLEPFVNVVIPIPYCELCANVYHLSYYTKAYIAKISGPIIISGP